MEGLCAVILHMGTHLRIPVIADAKLRKLQKPGRVINREQQILRHPALHARFLFHYNAGVVLLILYILILRKIQEFLSRFLTQNLADDGAGSIRLRVPVLKILKNLIKSLKISSRSAPGSSAA